MKVEINGRKHELHFGIEFIKEMDKRHTVTSNGVSFGMGINSALLYLGQGNPVILVDLIYAATATNENRPSIENITKFVESQEDIEALMKQFEDELGKQPLTKATVKKLKKNQEAEMARMKQENTI